MLFPRNPSKSITLSVRSCVLSVGLTFSSLGCAQEYATPGEAAKDPDFHIQGEYLGSVRFDAAEEPTRAGIQLAAQGEGTFKGFIYPGGLPGDGWVTKDGGQEPMTAERTNNVLQTEPIRGLTFRHEAGKFIAEDETGAERGRLERIIRTSPTEGKAPPEAAKVLFDGSNVEQWEDGARIVEGNLLDHGARSADQYGDIYLHVEFRPGFMPSARGQKRANSGIYIQNRYEVQILDTFAMPLRHWMCASLYRFKAPMMNMAFPPLQWQTYDIFFRAPHFDDAGKKTENTRITLFHNGVLVHDDSELPNGTGLGGRRPEVPKEHFLLQDHTGPVVFRNVWLLEDADASRRALREWQTNKTW